MLYSIAGKPVPFLILSFVCLIDAFAVFWVIQPKPDGRVQRNEHGERLQGTPMYPQTNSLCCFKNISKLKWKERGEKKGKKYKGHENGARKTFHSAKTVEKFLSRKLYENAIFVHNFQTEIRKKFLKMGFKKKSHFSQKSLIIHFFVLVLLLNNNWFFA